jgi:hypothetical protein
MSSYLVYICQAVRDRAGLERYWRDAPAAYPKNNVDVLAGDLHAPTSPIRLRRCRGRHAVSQLDDQHAYGFRVVDGYDHSVQPARIEGCLEGRRQPASRLYPLALDAIRLGHTSRSSGYRSSVSSWQSHRPPASTDHAKGIVQGSTPPG